MKNYVTGIITSPRKINYLSNTLDSYFDHFENMPHVFYEPGCSSHLFHQAVIKHQNKEKLGCVHNWLNCVQYLLGNTDSSHILILEDDIQFRDGIELILESTANATSGYLALPYKKNKEGWFQVDYSKYGWLGSLCFLWARDALELVYQERDYFLEAANDFGKIKDTLHLDFAIGKTLEKLNMSIWSHQPTLVLHSGDVSTYPNNDTGLYNKFREPAI